jgi:hypothetical protein
LLGRCRCAADGFLGFGAGIGTGDVYARFDGDWKVVFIRITLIDAVKVA